MQRIAYFLLLTYTPFYFEGRGWWADPWVLEWMGFPGFAGIRVGLSPNGLPASRFRDKWQIWDGKRKTCFSPSRIVTFLPIQKSFVPAGPKCDVCREGCDKKRHKSQKIFSCARASHSSKKCDKCDASHFLSTKKVTNVTSLTQIWVGNLGRNLGKTDPKASPFRVQTMNDKDERKLSPVNIWIWKLTIFMYRVDLWS